MIDLRMDTSRVTSLQGFTVQSYSVLSLNDLAVDLEKRVKTFPRYGGNIGTKGSC